MGEEDGKDSEEDSCHEPESCSEIESEESSAYDDGDDDSPLDLQELSDKSEGDSDDERDTKTFVDMPDLQVKKCCTTAFACSDSDSESNDGRDTEWQLRNENRETKTPTPRWKVRLDNEAERSMIIDISNVEAHDEEDSQQERSLSARVDLLKEVIMTSEASIPGVTKNDPRRSGRSRVEPRRHSSSDYSKKIHP